MLTVKVRGQDITIDHSIKTVYFKINRRFNGMFSLSDKLYHMTSLGGGGYKIEVDVQGKRIVVNNKTPIVRVEEVESKFADSKGWKRYWFSIPYFKKSLDTKELF